MNSAGRIDKPNAGSSPCMSVQDACGAVALEFALLAPIFLMIAFGIIVYGFYFGIEIAVTHAASEGARSSVAGLTDTERESLANAQAQAVIQSYSPLLSANSATISSAPVTGNSALFEVTVSYDFQSLGLDVLSNFVPVPAGNPTATSTVSHGGY